MFRDFAYEQFCYQESGTSPITPSSPLVSLTTVVKTACTPADSATSILHAFQKFGKKLSFSPLENDSFL
jgi:hypothetical protein